MITLLNKFDDNYVIKEKDILDVAASYISEYKLESYLSDVIFSSNTNHLGYYNLYTNEIVLNDKRIIECSYGLFDKLLKNYQIDENYYTYYLNFYYLYIIFHELRHVLQKARSERITDKESKLYNFLYYTCSQLRYNNIAFYNENHDLFPMEIDANTSAMLKAYSLMNCTKLPKRECKIIYLQYLKVLLFNYQRINSYRVIPPIEKLAEKNDFIDINKIYELTDKARINKINRMSYGLGITAKEYDSIINEENKILSKNI